MLLRIRAAGVRFMIRIFGKEVVLFHQPVDLQPVIEAVFIAAVVRTGVRSFLDVGSVL
jgi:hypothetical protein